MKFITNTILAEINKNVRTTIGTYDRAERPSAYSFVACDRVYENICNQLT